jgi:hypothetical protein
LLFLAVRIATVPCPCHTACKKLSRLAKHIFLPYAASFAPPRCHAQNALLALLQAPQFRLAATKQKNACISLEQLMLLTSLTHCSQFQQGTLVGDKIPENVANFLIWRMVLRTVMKSPSLVA